MAKQEDPPVPLVEPKPLSTCDLCGDLCPHNVCCYKPCAQCEC